MRATHVGVRGCSVCGGRVVRCAGICRKCWDKAVVDSVAMLKRGEIIRPPAPIESTPYQLTDMIHGEKNEQC